MVSASDSESDEGEDVSAVPYTGLGNGHDPTMERLLRETSPADFSFNVLPHELNWVREAGRSGSPHSEHDSEDDWEGQQSGEDQDDEVIFNGEASMTRSMLALAQVFSRTLKTASALERQVKESGSSTTNVLRELDATLEPCWNWLVRALDTLEIQLRAGSDLAKRGSKCAVTVATSVLRDL